MRPPQSALMPSTPASTAARIKLWPSLPARSWIRPSGSTRWIGIVGDATALAGLEATEVLARLPRILVLGLVMAGELGALQLRQPGHDRRAEGGDEPLVGG